MEVIDRTERHKTGNIDIKMLPVDIFILLTKYLSGMDIVRLSCVCKHLHEVFSYNKLWDDLFKRDRLKLDSTIMKTAMKDFGYEALKDMIGLSKAFYICHKKVDDNLR